MSPHVELAVLKLSLMSNWLKRQGAKVELKVNLVKPTKRPGTKVELNINLVEKKTSGAGDRMVNRFWGRFWRKSFLGQATGWGCNQ